WPEIGATLYQALAVGDGEWWLLWFYCAGGSLHTTYYESTHGGGARLAPYLVGTRTADARTHNGQVVRPPGRLPPGALAGGYRVDGPDLTIDCDGTGRVGLGARMLSVYAFAAIDCASCASADVAGWRELHALLWDAAAARACFGIFYLESPGSVRLEY